MKFLYLAYFLSILFLVGCNVPEKKQENIYVPPLDSEKSERADEYVTKGISLLNDDKLEEAIKMYDTAIDIDPYFSQAYSERADAKGRMRNYKDALPDCDKSVALSPNKEAVFYFRAQIEFNLMMFKETLTDLNKCIELNPEYINAYIARASVHFGMHNFKESLKDCENIMKLNPKRPEIYILRGEVYGVQGIKQLACENFLKAKKLGADLTVKQQKMCE